MQISLAVTDFSWPSPPAELAARLVALGQRADADGVTTLWIADHLLQMDPNAKVDDPMLEAYTTLGFLAAVTERVQLGTMVTWASLRAPALLVKQVSTLDVLSGGRAWFGVGAGYRGDEAAMLGLPFPPTGERFDRLEELLRLAAQMWRGDDAPFSGPFHQLDRALDRPGPLHRPRILIGGMGERRTLPMAARYADACNLFDIPDGGATVKHRIEVLGRACDAFGRDRAEIEVTLSSRLAPDETAAAFVDRCEGLRDLGIDHVVLVGNGPWRDDALDVVRDAIALGRAT